MSLMEEFNKNILPYGYVIPVNLITAKESCLNAAKRLHAKSVAYTRQGRDVKFTATINMLNRMTKSSSKEEMLEIYKTTDCKGETDGGSYWHIMDFLGIK
jgi:hypothetical protein